jgi:hypothetical protein
VQQGILIRHSYTFLSIHLSGQTCVNAWDDFQAACHLLYYLYPDCQDEVSSSSHTLPTGSC